MTTPTRRKPHSNWAGYRAERKNPHTGDHTVIVDCKLAEQQGNPWVEDYEAEGGRYMVVCNAHGTIAHVSSMRVAYMLIKDPTEFCAYCCHLAGEGPDPDKDPYI